MKRLTTSAVLVATLWAPHVALADDDAQRKLATEAYTQGMDLRAAGKNEQAVVRLAEAHRLFATPITGLELGRTYMLMNKLVEARDAFVSVGLVVPRATESAKANNARAESAALAVEVGARVPKIQWKHERPITYELKVDGVRVTDVDVVIALNPGPHTIDIGTDHRIVTLAPSKTETVALDAPTTASDVTVATPTPSVSPSRAPVWIGVAITGVATVLGVVSGVIALTDANAARPGCPSGECVPSAHADADAARTWSTVSTISFIGAGVFAITTVVLFFATRGSRASTAAQSMALPLSF